MTRLDPRPALVDLVIRLGVLAEGGASDADSVHRMIARTATRPERFAPPAWPWSRGLTVAVDDARGWPVYRVRAASDTTRPLARAVYLHGGAYFRQITVWHWRLVRYLALTSGVEVVVPIHPLAPTATAGETVEALTVLVSDELADADPAAVTLMGDSAGGGLALAVAQRLRDDGRALPTRIVLLSPWLDVTVSDPIQRDLSSVDHMLAPEHLREAGRLYAGTLDVRDPRVSPLYGDLAGLPPLTVHVGTHDILLPDSRRLRRDVDAAGGTIAVTEFARMPHVFTLMPLLAQARRSRETIAAVVAGRPALH